MIANQKRSCRCTGNEMDNNWMIPTAASFLHFCALGVQYSFGLYFLPIAREFGSNRGTTAWTSSLLTGLMLAAGLSTGVLFDRFDSRVLLSVGSVLLSAGLVGASLSESFSGLCVCVCISGIGCSFHIQAVSVVQCWFDRRRGLATGISMAGSGLGNFLYALCLGAFLESYPADTAGSWRVALRWEALFTLALALPASILLKKRESTARESGARTPAGGSSSVFKRLIITRRFLTLCCVKFFGSFAYTAPFVHLVPLANDRGLGKNSQAWALSLVGIASLLGRIVSGYLGDRCGHHRMLTISLVQLSACLFLFPHCTSNSEFYFYVVWFGFNGGAFPSLPPSIIGSYFRQYPNVIGKMVGLNFLADTCGAIFGPPIVGAMFDASGSYISGFSFMGGMFALAMIGSCLLPDTDVRAVERTGVTGTEEAAVRTERQKATTIEISI